MDLLNHCTHTHARHTHARHTHARHTHARHTRYIHTVVVLIHCSGESSLLFGERTSRRFRSSRDE
jgi:hypothetical protein